eukprot:m.164618 g.164618  ORF g.164618 m.164618 type:complete len:65 (+) comp14403_c0_seq1:4557-4751(+)
MSFKLDPSQSAHSRKLALQMQLDWHLLQFSHCQTLTTTQHEMNVVARIHLFSQLQVETVAFILL